MCATVRIDAVTRRFFNLVGVSVDQWMSELLLQRDPFSRTSGRQVWKHRAAGNPCGEIPCIVPSEIDLFSLKLIDDGPIDSAVPTSAHIASLRIGGGTINLGGGARYHPGGDRHVDMDPHLTIPGSYPDTLVQALVGRPATNICDTPVLEGAVVTDVKRDRRLIAFWLDIPWETVETVIAPPAA